MDCKNKIKKSIEISGILIASIFLYSCEGFLDGQPLDKVTEADVWQDINLTEAFVNDIYGNMRDGHQLHMSFSVVTDESYARERTGAHLIQRGDVNPSDLGYMSWTWSHYYSIIKNSNVFLENVSGENRARLSALDETRVNRMIGEVKVLRAFAYHRLTSLYGGVPLITVPFGLGDNMMVERDSYDEVVNFIIEELDEAASLLPLTYPDNHLGRITRGAALAIKSRVFLYAASPLHNPENNLSKWQDAADAARQVIDLGLYALHPDYAETFTEAGNFNDERIWELVRNSEVWQRFALERNLFPNGDDGWAVTVPVQEQVDSYETLNGLLPKDDPTYKPYENPWENRDPRFYATILYDGAPFRGREIEAFTPGGLDSNEGPSGPWNYSRTGYYTKKFVTENWDRPLGESSSTNWIMVRYTEILLNYAEAQYHLGNENIAREYINMIRNRPTVEMPGVTDSGPDLLDRIKNERRVELYLEEHRFFDIRRWKVKYPDQNAIGIVRTELDTNTGEKTISYGTYREWALPEHTYLLPIPQSEIDRNPLLEQNPGY